MTIKKIDDEYLTAAAGPTSHSPPPIDVAAITAPGPMTRIMFRRLNGGGAVSSETSHAGSSPWPGGRKADRNIGGYRGTDRASLTVSFRWLSMAAAALRRSPLSLCALDRTLAETSGRNPLAPILASSSREW